MPVNLKAYVKMHNFLEKYKSLELTQEEIGNLNSIITIKEIESVVYKVYSQKVKYQVLPNLLGEEIILLLLRLETGLLN